MIDGDAFCKGINTKNRYSDSTDLESLIRPVCYLIRQSFPTSQYLMPISTTSNLGIAPLSELVEMYFTHEATKHHDKVYALLGMCSDDVNKAGLLPDYHLPWDVLLQRLLKHLVSQQISVETHVDRHLAVIRSKARILGEVLIGNRDRSQGDQYEVTIRFRNLPQSSGVVSTFEAKLLIKSSTFLVERSDLVCLLQGSSTCTIVRPCYDYFQVLVLSFQLPPTFLTNDGHIAYKCLSELPCERDMLLVWDREVSANFDGPETGSPNSLEADNAVSTSSRLTCDYEERDYERWMQTNGWMPAQSGPCGERHLNKAMRAWNAALVFEDISEKENWSPELDFDAVEKAVVRYDEAIINCEIGMTEEGSYTWNSIRLHPADMQTRNRRRRTKGSPEYFHQLSKQCS